MILPQIPHVRLRAVFRARATARLPPLQGSMLRGGFGHALRAAVCSMAPDQPCATCSLRPRCVYTRLFETFVEGEPPPFLRGVATSPRPYVFEPRSERQDFRPGDRLEADLILVGQATELQPYAALALARMAGAGFGAARAPFRLESLSHPLPDGGWRNALEPAAAPTGKSNPNKPVFRPAPALLPRKLRDPGEAPLTLRFLTPTRLMKKGQVIEELSFRRLAFVMLRRVLEMAHFHVPGAAVSWELGDALAQAGEVELVRSALQWRDSSRYSSRQGRRHTTAGVVGEIDVAGPLGPFLPLLAAAEVLHVGKGATFGLGRLEVAA